MGAATRLPNEIAEYDQSLELLGQSLGENDRDAAIETGRLWDRDKAIEYARSTD